jgi:tRNA A-37 threonylcarbamoyl transferase component Bud32
VTALSLIGRGTFATVYVGYEQSFDRRVAVKVLDVRHLDAAAARTFERECAAMRRMTAHPYAVAVYRAALLESGQPVLVTEYCAGGSSEHRLRRSGPLPAAEVADIGAKIADALRRAHRLGIIHRDVTPANILLRDDGQPALADFRLSVRTDAGAGTGPDAPSPAHAAPETLARGDYTQASDTYSLGSTLYTLLAGHPPLPWSDGEPPVPDRDRADLPPELSSLITAMLAVRPQDRPSDDEVVGRLQGLATGVPTVAAPLPALAPSADRPPVPATDPWAGPFEDTRMRSGNGDLRTGPPPAVRPIAGTGRGRRVAVVSAATVLVLAAAGGVAFAAGLFPRHDHPVPAAAPTGTATTVGPAPTSAAPDPTTVPTTVAPTTPVDTVVPPPTAPPPTSDAPISTATPISTVAPVVPVPPGYRLLSGVRGIQVAVPDGWTVREGFPIASNTQVSDPVDGDRLVRFGGDPPEGVNVGEKVATLARTASSRDGYRELQRRPVAFGGGTAWDWEFSYLKDGVRMHAYGRYWRVDSVDYVVYAAAPEPAWPGLVPVLQVMVDTATPR